LAVVVGRDGLLDICIYKCASQIHLMKHSVMIILKRQTLGPDVIYRQAAHITVSSDAPGISTEIDGDPGPGLPVEIKVMPKAVRIIVPEDARPAGLRKQFIRALG